MRILASIGLFFAGIAAIAYAYVEAYAAVGQDIVETAERGEQVSAFNKAMEIIMTGKLPEPTNFLYLGLLLIAIGVVTLIVTSGKKKDDDGHSV